MTNHDTIDDETECGLHRFERNRFFHGKLMTARDMQAEQRYHRNRLRTLAEHVIGRGIVSGLETTVEENDGSLVVTIDPGLAIDGCGHPIVVATRTTKQFDRNEVSDPVSLYVDYDDCVKETVPVPGAEDACEEECTYNRILETFELTHERDPPSERKPVEAIEFPGRTEYEANGDARDPATIDATDDALRRIATSYDPDESDEDSEPEDEQRIFLGRFGTDDDGDWSRVTDPGVEARSRVYTNDMLYAAVARHAARFDDPHDVTAAQTGALASVEGVSNPGGNVDLFSSDGSVSTTGDDAANEVDIRVADAIQNELSDLSNRVEELSSHVEDLSGQVEELEERLDASHRQLLRSTLHHKRLAFRLLAERFDAEPAAAVVELATEAIESEVYREPEAYVEFVEEMLDPEEAVAEALSGVDAVDAASIEQYARAVEELRVLLEEGTGEFDDREFFTAVGHAQGLVAETAEWLDSGTSGESPPPDDEPTIDEDALRESMEIKLQVFEGIAGRFDVESAMVILERTQRALDAGAYTSASAYREFIAEIVELEKQVNQELVAMDAPTAASIGDYARAVVTLERLVDGGENVASLRDGQRRVARTAGALERGDGQIVARFDPTEFTVEELEEVLSELREPQSAETILALELANEDRTSAVDLILRRIRDLET